MSGFPRLLKVFSKFVHESSYDVDCKLLLLLLLFENTSPKLIEVLLLLSLLSK